MQLLGVFNIALLQHLTWNGSINLQIFSENEKDNYRTEILARDVKQTCISLIHTTYIWNICFDVVGLQGDHIKTKQGEITEDTLASVG
jgi:hypothetical protein